MAGQLENMGEAEAGKSERNLELKSEVTYNTITTRLMELLLSDMIIKLCPFKIHDHT